MADKKISALSSLGSAVAGVDLLHIIDNSATPINKNISITDLFQNIPIPVALASAQDITGDVDVDITSSITRIDGAALGNSFSKAMAASTKDGQIKIITMNTAPSSNRTFTVTPAAVNGYTNLVFSKQGDTAILVYSDNVWNLVGSQGNLLQDSVQDKITSDTITSSGAVSLTTDITKIASTGSMSITLATGTFPGQKKILIMTADGGDVTMTKADGNLADNIGFGAQTGNVGSGQTNNAGAALNTSIVWNDVGDFVELVYNGSKWVATSRFGAIIT